jgi:hypothetical protein
MSKLQVQSEVTPEDSVEVKAEPRQPTKLEMKRQQIFVDRMKRHMANGLDQRAAAAAIAREDYERLPVDQKLSRIERVFSQAHQGLATDVQKVHSNQVDLADTMDVNFRAFGKMLEKLGLKGEDQKACFDEAVAELTAEHKAAESAEVAAQVETAGEAPEPAEGSTVFGG